MTGASGFLGHLLCPRLAVHGAEVHAVSRDLRKASDSRLRWWKADLQQLSDVERLWDAIQPSVVYHLSGEVNGAPDLDLLLPTYHSLLTSTVNLLAMCARRQNARLVLVGSLEEKGLADGSAPPSSPYAAAKTAASEYARMCHKLFGASTVILRTFMSYGPGQPEWKVIPATVNSLLKGVRPRLSSGSRELDWVYVEDVVEAFVAAAVAPRIDGMTLDIGSGHLTSIAEIVRVLVNSIDPSLQPEFGVLADRPERPARVADTERTVKYLGWQAGISLHEGLDRTLAWYRRRG